MSTLAKLARLDHSWTGCITINILLSNAEQLDSQLECTALDFPYQLSAHRPISFVRRHSKRNKSGVAPLQAWTIADDSWSDSVRASFTKRCNLNPQAKPPQRIQFLEDAMRNASTMVRRKALHREATSIEDRISATMMLLRAHEHRSSCRAKRAVSLYPRL